MARAKLGEILIQQGIIDASALKLALGAQIRFASQHMKLGQVLVDMGACTAEHVAQALATQMGVPYSDLAHANPAAIALLPVDLCTRHHAIAIAAEAGPPELVHVAFADPLDLGAVDAVRSRLAKRVKPFIASAEAIAAKLAALSGAGIDLESGPADRVDLGDVLFSDEGGGTLAIEHEEPGQVRVAGSVSMGNDERSVDLDPGDGAGDDLFARGATPLPLAATVRGSTPLPAAPTGAADFDSLFGPEPTATAPDPVLPMVDEVAPVLEGTVAPLADPPAPPPLYSGPPPAPVAVHHFADHRPPKPKPVPAPEPEPVAELSSEALFGDAPPPPEPVATPLLGAEFDSGREEVSPAPQAGLFGSARAHVGEQPGHDDPVAHEPAHRESLFGAAPNHLSEHTSGEGLEALSAPSPTPSADEGPGEWDAPAASAAATSVPPAAADEDQLEVDFSETELDAPAAVAVSAPAPNVAPPPAAPEAPSQALPSALAALKPPPTSNAADSLRPPAPTSALLRPPTPAALRPPTPIPALKPVESATPAQAARPPTPTAPAPTQAPERAPSSIPAPQTTVGPPSSQLAVEPELEPVAPKSAASPPSGSSDLLSSFADRPLTEAEIEVINAIESLADGTVTESEIKQVKPAQMVAALVRLLIRQGVIQETDFLAELSRK